MFVLRCGRALARAWGHLTVTLKVFGRYDVLLQILPPKPPSGLGCARFASNAPHFPGKGKHPPGLFKDTSTSGL